jgi:hypothetical protein
VAVVSARRAISVNGMNDGLRKKLLNLIVNQMRKAQKAQCLVR